MLADFLREVAVLVLVFVPLDLFAHKGISASRVLGVILVSGLILAFGIALERKRPWANLPPSL